MAFSIGLSAKPGHGFFSQLWPKRPTLGADLDLVVQEGGEMVKTSVDCCVFLPACPSLSRICKASPSFGSSRLQVLLTGVKVEAVKAVVDLLYLGACRLQQVTYAEVKQVIALVGMEVEEGSLVMKETGMIELGTKAADKKKIGEDTVGSTNKDGTVDSTDVEEVTTLVVEGGQKVVVHWGQQQHDAEGSGSHLLARSINQEGMRNQEKSTTPVVSVRDNQGNIIQEGQGRDTFIDLTLDIDTDLAEETNQVKERPNEVNRSRRLKQNRDGNGNFPDTPGGSSVKSIEQDFDDQEGVDVTQQGSDADTADKAPERKKQRLSRGDRMVIAEGERLRNHPSQSARRSRCWEKGYFEGADLRAEYASGMTKDGRELVSCRECNFFIAGHQVLHSKMEPRSFGFMTPIAFLEKHTLEIHFGEGDGYACKHKKCNFETSSKKLLKRHMETVPHRNGCARATFGYIQEDGDFVQAPVTLVKSLLV